MNLKRLSAATATGVLTLGLALGAPASANAAVKAGDVPSKTDIVKAFPEMKDGEFTNQRLRKIDAPAAKCGTFKKVAVKSSYNTSGAVATANRATVIGAGVAEFKSVKAAKAFFKSYKATVKKCKSYTLDGVKVTQKNVSAPKVGQERLAVARVVTIEGFAPGYGADVLIRQGKRIAVLGAGDNAKISSTKMNKLAKVAAKKMK